MLSLATNVIVAIASIIVMVNIASFQFIIVEVYVLAVSILVFLSDIHRPLVCGEYFSFLKYFWGRFLLYLLLGALVFFDLDGPNSVSFTEVSVTRSTSITFGN